MTCEECGQEIPNMRFARASKRFCSDKCRYRHYNRLRYERDPEGERARSRAYYVANREKVLARMKAARDDAASRHDDDDTDEVTTLQMPSQRTESTFPLLNRLTPGGRGRREHRCLKTPFQLSAK
jgi:hypothetical protein